MQSVRLFVCQHDDEADEVELGKNILLYYQFSNEIK